MEWKIGFVHGSQKLIGFPTLTQAENKLQMTLNTKATLDHISSSFLQEKRTFYSVANMYVDDD